MIRHGLVMLVAVWCASSAQAAVHTEPVEYHDGETTLQGYLAYDNATITKRPGVIVVHEWKGLTDYTKRRAEQLAQLGYIAFAIDMYGKGVVAKDHEEAAKLSGAFRSDRQRMRARARAGLAVLKRHPLTDTQRLAAIGYCFGGTTVLELARSGEDIKGVVSVHGVLDTPHPEDAKQITGKVLVLQGADDPYVKADQIAAFEQEMTVAGVDDKVITYPGVVHSFTVPDAGNDPTTGAAYNADADRQSWETMRAFLSTVLK